VGTQVTITGTSFTGAKKVTFGGVKATVFSVDSDTLITATVPTGAKTGKIQITTPGGIATSPGAGARSEWAAALIQGELFLRL
jgi:hypothetical protein